MRRKSKFAYSSLRRILFISFNKFFMQFAVLFHGHFKTKKSYAKRHNQPSVWMGSSAAVEQTHGME